MSEEKISKGESRQLFEWVKASELKEINWPVCIRYDGGGAYWYGTVCFMKELQSHVSEHNSISEIEYAKPIQSSLKEEMYCAQACEKHEWIEVELTSTDAEPQKFVQCRLCGCGKSLTSKSISDSELVGFAQYMNEIFIKEGLLTYPSIRSAVIAWKEVMEASLKPNKLTESKIEKMAEEYARQFYGDFTDNNTEESTKSSFIAGAQAIINNQK